MKLSKTQIIIITLFIILFCVCMTFLVGVFGLSAFVSSEQPTRKIVSNTLPVRLLWKTKSSDKIISLPIIAGDTVIIPTDDAIIALQTNMGQELWRHNQKDYNGQIPMLVVGNRVIFGLNKGPVIGLDIETGNELWEYEFGAGVNDIVTDGVLIYTLTKTARISALNPEDGIPIWQTEYTGHKIGDRSVKMFYGNQEVYIMTFDNLYVFESQTGKYKRFHYRGSGFSEFQLKGRKFYYDDIVYRLSGLEDFKLEGDLARLNSKEFKDERQECHRFVLPYAFSEKVFLGIGECGGIFGLDGENYRVKWTYRQDINARNPMAVYKGYLYTLFRNGELHAIDPETGLQTGILKTDTPSYPYQSGVVANGSLLLVAFGDNNIWAFCEEPCSK